MHCAAINKTQPGKTIAVSPEAGIIWRWLCVVSFIFMWVFFVQEVACPQPIFLSSNRNGLRLALSHGGCRRLQGASLSITILQVRRAGLLVQEAALFNWAAGLLELVVRRAGGNAQLHATHDTVAVAVAYGTVVVAIRPWPARWRRRQVWDLLGDGVLGTNGTGVDAIALASL